MSKENMKNIDPEEPGAVSDGKEITELF